MMKDGPVEERSNMCLHKFKEFDNVGTWLIHNSEAQLEVLLADIVGTWNGLPQSSTQSALKATAKDNIVISKKNTDFWYSRHH